MTTLQATLPDGWTVDFEKFEAYYGLPSGSCGLDAGGTVTYPASRDVEGVDTPMPAPESVFVQAEHEAIPPPSPPAKVSAAVLSALDAGTATDAQVQAALACVIRCGGHCA